MIRLVIKIRKHLCFAVFTAILCACASKKVVIDKQTEPVTNPKLIFLNYKISQNDAHQKNMQFVSYNIVDGSFKNSSFMFTDHPEIGDLKCIQLNKDSVPTDFIFIKNPLFKTVEYLNDSLIFDSKIMRLKNTTLSFKLPLHTETKFIAIKEVIDSLQSTKPLITTTLN